MKNRIIPFLVFASLVAGCGVPGKIRSVQGCDLREGSRCTQPYGETRIYHVEIPAARRKTWRDLAYYLYFHSRVTPGVRIDFEAPVPEEKLSSFKKEPVCRYTLQDGEQAVHGELEGIRVDEDGAGVWCFDYLGTMLLKLVRERGMEELPPDPSYFPLDLDLEFQSDLLGQGGRQSSRVILQWDGSDAGAGAGEVH